MAAVKKIAADAAQAKANEKAAGTKKTAAKTAEVKKPAIKAKVEPKKTTTAKAPATKKTPAASVTKKPAPKVVQKPPVKAEPKMPTMADMPSLKKGSLETGPITLLQMNLANRGYYDGKVDGNFGPKTEGAVMEFQKDLGKPVSGTVGPKTWEALQDSKVVKVRPAVEPVPIAPAPVVQNAPAGNCRVLIEGLTRFQAEMLVKILTGNTSCRILS